jgi:hypothetical protein
LRKPVSTAYGIVLASVRTKFRWSKARLAAETGKSVPQLTRYEKGDQELFRPMLREILAPFPLEGPEEAIDAFVFAHDLTFPQGPGDSALTAAERRTMNRAALAAGLAAAEAVRDGWSRRKKAEKTEAARHVAESVWTTQGIPGSVRSAGDAEPLSPASWAGFPRQEPPARHGSGGPALWSSLRSRLSHTWTRQTSDFRNRQPPSRERRAAEGSALARLSSGTTASGRARPGRWRRGARAAVGVSA